MSIKQRGSPCSVNLYWMPLGAGGSAQCVRWNGRQFEALAARHGRRERCDLYHSALQVQLGNELFVIEMAPVWGNEGSERGVVGEGAVGHPYLGRSKYFRYEVRRWRDGVIPDSRMRWPAHNASAQKRRWRRSCWTSSPPFHWRRGDVTSSRQATCGTPTH